MPVQRTGAARAFRITALPLLFLGIAVIAMAAFGPTAAAAAAHDPTFYEPQQDDLGLGLDQPVALTGGKAGLTILYDAATAGELHPCPT